LTSLCKWFYSISPKLNKDEELTERNRPYTTLCIKELKDGEGIVI
jgi:hypothetical protein